MRVKHLFFVFLIFLTAFAWGQQARMTDDEVKKTIDEAYKTSEKFRDAFKKVSSVTTRNGVQVEVKQYMNDYDQAFKRFKDGFESTGAPSTDLLNVFRMTSEIDGVMTRNADAAGAGSEWQAHKFNMDRLAQAFHTTLGEEPAAPRRMSDDQMKAATENMLQTSKMLTKSTKDAMKKDASIDKSLISSTEQSFKALEKKAETVKKLYNDKKPLTVELQDFLKQMETARTFFAEHPLSSAVQNQWNTLDAKAKSFASEYGL